MRIRKLAALSKIFLLGIVTFNTILLHATCCVSIPKHLNQSALSGFHNLNANNRATVHKILNKIENRPKEQQEYYFKKINLLLATPTISGDSKKKNELANKNRRRLNRATIQVKEKIDKMPEEDKEIFLQAEEEYETYGSPNWEKRTPEGSKAFFLVCRDDPTDILVKIFVRVIGQPNIVNKVISLEDAIEKHLGIPGFSVNLTFVNEGGPHVFDVGSSLHEWITSDNWGGSAQVMAHELMHLMGLKDEYDGIANHADNEHLSITTRLYYFNKQLDEPFLPDANEGIMGNHNKRPLHRHVCEAVGLDVDSCTKERLKYLGL